MSRPASSALSPAAGPLAGPSPVPGLLAEGVDVELRHGEHLAVARSSFALPAGGVVAVIGPNGSGKSTLLQALAGVLEPSAGRVRVLGETAARRSRRTAFVMQTLQFPQGVPVTVRDVVTMGRYARRGWFGRLRAQDREAVDAAMERMHVADLARRHLDQLSGGQRQRVYVAQGLAQEHDVLMLDEPMTGLDLVSARTIDELIHERPAEGVSVVFTTHDLEEAAAADHVVLMGGRVIASGAPETVLTDAHLEEVYGRGALHAPRMPPLDDPAGGPHHC